MKGKIQCSINLAKVQIHFNGQLNGKEILNSATYKNYN